MPAQVHPARIHLWNSLLRVPNVFLEQSDPFESSWVAAPNLVLLFTKTSGMTPDVILLEKRRTYSWPRVMALSKRLQKGIEFRWLRQSSIRLKQTGCAMRVL